MSIYYTSASCKFCGMQFLRYHHGLYSVKPNVSSLSTHCQYLCMPYKIANRYLCICREKQMSVDLQYYNDRYGCQVENVAKAKVAFSKKVTVWSLLFIINDLGLA